MSDRGKYDPTVNPGDTRFRIWRTAGENPLNATRSKRFHEEEVVLTASGERCLGRSRDLTLEYDPATASTSFPMRHPETDAIIGQMTILDALVAEYSLARYVQMLHDEQEAPASSEPEAIPDP